MGHWTINYIYDCLKTLGTFNNFWLFWFIWRKKLQFNIIIIKIKELKREGILGIRKGCIVINLIKKNGGIKIETGGIDKKDEESGCRNSLNGE